MSVTGWVLLYAWVYLLITIIFAEILTYRGRTSLNFMQLKHPMDWIILVAVLIASAGGVALLIGYKHRPKSHLWFWLGQLGGLMAINGLLTFVDQATMAQYAKLTRSNVKHILQLITGNYYAEYALLALVMVGMLWLNYRQGWLKRNNWYYFWTMAPYIIETGIVYHYQLGWQTFTSMTGFTASRLYDLLSAYQHYDNTISVLLMDDSTNPSVIVLGIASAAVIYIGGEYLVWKWQQAHKGRKAQAQRKQKES